MVKPNKNPVIKSSTFLFIYKRYSYMFFPLNSKNDARSVENPLSVENLKDHLWRKEANKMKQIKTPKPK